MNVSKIKKYILMFNLDSKFFFLCINYNDFRGFLIFELIKHKRSCKIYEVIKMKILTLTPYGNSQYLHNLLSNTLPFFQYIYVFICMFLQYMGIMYKLPNSSMLLKITNNTTRCIQNVVFLRNQCY